jgi:hypothetical protein
LLYEMLSGKPPFRAVNALNTLFQIVNQEAVPLSRVRPGMPRDLATICHRCLAKDPAKRYPTAAALADDLRRFLNGEPIQARPTPAWERLLKWARRRSAVAALVAVGFVAVFALLLAGVGYERQRRKLETEVRKALDPARGLPEQSHTDGPAAAVLAAKALEQAERARALLETGAASAALEEQVQQLLQELHAEEKDYVLVAALAAARTAQAETVVEESRFAAERAIPLYRQAFQTYGLSVGVGDPAAVKRNLLAFRPSGG